MVTSGSINKNNYHLLKFILPGVLKFGLLIFSFYSALLISSFFSLPFSNPYDIIGPTISTQYNPQNNFLRYLILFLITPSFYYGLDILIAKNRSLLVRIIFITILLLSFLINQLSFYNSRVGNIDMFHDGEQLGVGSAIYNFNKVPFLEVFFLHGAFTDPYISVLAFKLFGASIGSFYLLNSLLAIFSFLVFLICLSILIKNNLLFIFSCLVLYISSPSPTLVRDVLSIIWITTLFKALSSNTWHRKINFFLIGFLSFITLYVTLDRGYYLLASSVAFSVIYLLGSIFTKKPFFKQELINKVINLSILTSGVILANLLGLLFWGQAAYLEFLKISFIQLPKFKPYLDEYFFPGFSFQTIYPFWWPIIFGLINFFLAIEFYKNNKSNATNLSTFLVAISILGAFYYRSALGRSDIGHITYVTYFIFLITFIIVDNFLGFTKKSFQKILLFLLTLLILILPYQKWDKLMAIPKFNPEDLILFATLPQTKDDKWLNLEQLEVTNFIVKNTTIDDYIFVFTNESVYYYLTNRQNPSRFYTVWFASPNIYQTQLITDLAKTPPKYIIYNSSFWSNAIDGVSEATRQKQLNLWIEKNYLADQIIGSTTILKYRY